MTVVCSDVSRLYLTATVAFEKSLPIRRRALFGSDGTFTPCNDGAGCTIFGPGPVAVSLGFSELARLTGTLHFERPAPISALETAVVNALL